MVHQKPALLVFELLCICSAAMGDHDHDNLDLDLRLGNLFWVVFILSVSGFFVYLVCTYAPFDQPPPASHSKREDCVVNVRILNLPELTNQWSNSHGRTFSPQPCPSA